MSSSPEEEPPSKDETASIAAAADTNGNDAASTVENNDDDAISTSSISPPINIERGGETTLPNENLSTWAQSLQADFIDQNLVKFDFDTLLDKTASKNVNELTSSISSIKGLAILSIASGIKGSTILLHNIEVVGNLTVALTGAGQMSSIHILDMKKAFKKKNGVLVPSALPMLQNGGEGTDITKIPLTEDDTQETSIPSSFISPPWLTKIIFNEELTSAKDVLLAAVDYLRLFTIHENVGDKEISDADKGKLFPSLDDEDVEGR